MSGIEIAGLILGAIPILVNTLTHYADGVSTVERFFQYKRELSSLVRLLNLEVVMLRNTCEQLLDGIHNADPLEKMLDEPEGTTWKDLYLQEQLRSRLRNSYGPYFETLDEMYAAVQLLKDRLKRDGVAKVSVTDT
jgi:thymidylate synthase